MTMTPAPKADRRHGLRAAVIGLAILLGVLAAPVVASVVIALQNDAAARTVADRLVAMPLPPETTLVDSYARAGKLVGNGNGMQYFGAILIQSDLTAAELKDYYDAQADIVDETRTSEYPTRIAVQPGGAAELQEIRNISSFLAQADQPGRFVVSLWGDAPSPIHEEFDLRGH